MTDYQNKPPHEFVDAILRDALSRGASDIYWLPRKASVAIRFKTDGHQDDVGTVPHDYGTQCIARLKVLAGLLTYRSSVAQDGAIHGVAGYPDAELRAASLPTHHGERITLRILHQQASSLSLDGLGFEDAVLHALRELLARPTGMLILTGPTGSGKTTTIYAMIHELLQGGHDPATLITIEDPIERAIEHISQVQVTRAGEDWGYPEALRAALRHDVKTLVIGEMRDKDIVRVALDAALTGHRVITTFHAGDIPAVYGRLLHLGFEPFLIAAAVAGVVSQRLVQRRDGTGQVPVAALLRATDEWRDVITANPGLADLRRRVAAIPGADLTAAAQQLASQGRIHEKDVYLL
ncbi:MAG: hypothetical protein A3K19_04780 [Lentisphaerae bacterium RIFOXYB12_FULL_65_16]|nr:MAG: hypothetical protein A3K18_11520 [Lentisphaerae bacterium RIFOXYA12_64_32]OGV84046.1 MAG: hypothetical protein A3K19_04780 [Lentisphaerae bacterium RIFOXYB12_FULL_65_16]